MHAATSDAIVDAVSLDLVVHDRKNRAVLDLKPEDLAVTDNDAPVTLTGLHLLSGKTGSEHLVTFLFDRLDPDLAKSASSIAGKILRMVPSTGFDFAVMQIEGRMRLYQSFTTDRRLIEEAAEIASDKKQADRLNAAAGPEKWLRSVAQTGLDPSGAHVSLQERTRDQMLLSALQDSQRIVQDQHSLPSLAGLLALARSQQQAPERKTIIYFTQHSQMDSTSKDMVRSIIGAANRASVTIYTVDLKSLDAGTQQQLMATMDMGDKNALNAVNPGLTVSAGLTGQTPLVTATAAVLYAQSSGWGRHNGSNSLENNANPVAVLAAETGGEYVDAADNLRRPLEQMLQDMTTYYQASYIPAIQDYDGKFRAIAIKSTRTGLLIRSRSGYFALPPGSGAEIRPFEAPLLKALSDPELPSDLKFHAAILRLGDLPSGNTNIAAVEVPLSEIGLHQDYNTQLYSAHVSIVAQIKDTNGTVIEHFSEDIPRHGSLDAIDAAKRDTFTMQRHFSAAPGKYVLEAAVLDQIGEKTSAQRIDFEIPTASVGPSLSDLVLVRQMDAFRGDPDTVEPLRYVDAKIRPNLSGVVIPDTTDLSLFLMLHPDATLPEPLQLEMDVFRDGKAAGHMPLPIQAGSGSGAIPYLASFRGSALVDGAYEIKATLRQGRKTTSRNISFTVEGGRRIPGMTGVASPALTDGNVSDREIAEAGGAKFDADESKFATAGPAGGQLLITASSTPIASPGPEEVRAMLSSARERAVKYSDSLPNFMCVEVTNRSIDANGRGNWKHRDTIAELLRYKDKLETRSTLEVDGKRSNEDRDSLEGARSYGEFGTVLGSVFRAESKADFRWKETDTLGTGTVQVFEYRVAKANSTFKLTNATNHQLTVGFHGQVFLDSATRSVRRLTMEADDIPRGFSIQASSIGVDYDYIAINSHDYLMPVSGSISVTEDHKGPQRNDFEFRDYRRYGSDAKLIMNADPETAPETKP